MLPADQQSSTVRDARLDILRGLCLLNMVIVHLLDHNVGVPWVVNEVLMHWLRFAAGGFVFASGLCVGAIHYHRSHKPQKRLSTHVSLWKRAGIVLIVHYFSTLLALVLVTTHGHPIVHGPKMVVDVLRFWIGMDLLLFYVLMLAMSPLVIEAIRRVGVLPILALSATVYVLSIHNPYLALYPIETKFPVLYWQLMYVAGICGGVVLPKFDALATRTKWRLFAGGLSLALCIATIGALQTHFDLRWPLLADAAFADFPGLEALRYIGLTVAVAILVDRSITRLAPSFTGRTLALMGSWTLLLWVVHGPIVEYVARYPWVLATLLAVLGVFLAARVADWLNRHWDRLFRSLPRLSYAGPVVGAVLLAALLVRLDQPPEQLDAQFAGHAEPDEPPMFMHTEELDDLSPREPIPVEFDSIVDEA